MEQLTKMLTTFSNKQCHDARFENIKYQLTGQEIESILHPGQATTMHGLLKYPDDFCKYQGLNQLSKGYTSHPRRKQLRLGHKKKVHHL